MRRSEAKCVKLEAPGLGKMNIVWVLDGVRAWY